MNYANINDIKVGDKLIADGGFTCMSNGEVKEVKSYGGGLVGFYVDCAEGTHNLEGQVDDEQGFIVGLTKA